MAIDAAFVPFEILHATDLDSAINGSTDFGVAATGTNQGTAYAIKARWTVFSTVAASTGAILPASGWTWLYVVNMGLNNLSLYPAGTGQVNLKGASVPLLIPPKSPAMCLLYGTGLVSAT